jgi:hypothetical protein
MKYIAQYDLAGLCRFNRGSGKRSLNEDLAQVASGQILQRTAKSTDRGARRPDENDLSSSFDDSSFQT